MPIVRKRHIKGINLDPVDLTLDSLNKEGDLALDSSDSKLKYRDGSATRTVVNTDEEQTFSNKNLDNTNTVNYENLAIGTIDPLQKDMADVDNVADALDAIRVLIDGQDQASEIGYTIKTGTGDNWNSFIDEEITKVDLALDELASRVTANKEDIISDGQALQNHLNNATGAHAASAISSVASGNLTATDVQAALDELQSDVDTRALADMGTITNATIQDASIESPIRLDVKKDELTDLETYATTASDGQIVFATDTKKMFQVIDNVLEPIGAGGATQFEVDQVAHGLLVGSGVYYNGTSNQWETAQADSADTLATYVVIEASTDKFVAADFGRVEVSLLTNPYSLAAGNELYLSEDIAGQPTTTEPSIFSNPLFYVESLDATDPNNQLAILQVKVYRPESVEADELFPEISQTILDNQSDVSVNGIALNTAVHRGLSLSYSLFRTNDEGLEVAQIGQLRIVYKVDNVSMSNVFSISDDFAGDDSGIEFSVDANGQVQYTSSALGGTSPTGILKIKGSEVFFQ